MLLDVACQDVAALGSNELFLDLACRFGNPVITALLRFNALVVDSH
jgi:hypothetical protein